MTSFREVRPGVYMRHDPDAYGRQRDDADHDRATLMDYDPQTRRDFLDATCGVTCEQYFDADPEGVMWV